MKRGTMVTLARAAAAGLVLIAATTLAPPGWGQEPGQGQELGKEKDKEPARDQGPEQGTEKGQDRGRRHERERGRGPDRRGPAATIARKIGHELHLSRDQRRSLRELLQQHASDLRGVAREIGEARRILREQSLADTFDEAAIRGASGRLGAAIGTGSVLVARIAGEVRPLLTPEQRDQLRKASSRWDERHGRWLSRVERWDGN